MSDSTSLVAAITEKNAVEARLASLRLRVARGELVKRLDMQQRYQSMALRIRDHLLAAPSRHAPELAARFGVEAPALCAALEQLLRNFLTDQADKPEPETRKP